MGKKSYVYAVTILSCLGVLCLCACSDKKVEEVMTESVNELPVSGQSGVKESSTEDSPVEVISSNTTERVEEDLIAEYTGFLSALTVHDSKAIPKAYEEFQKLTLEENNTQINDELFREFESFFHLVQASISDTILPVDDMAAVLDVITQQSQVGSYYEVMDRDSFSEDAYIQMSALLRDNGYAAFFSEGGYYLSEDPKFLREKFLDAPLSEGVKEYLDLRSKYLQEGAVIDDAGLRMSWDELSDRIIAWETYAGKYPGTQEADTAVAESENYFDIYMTCRYLDNTPMFRDEILTDDVRESYKRFIQTYPDSKYNKIVSDYYKILEQNQFQLTEEAIDYLAGNGLDISIPDYSQEPSIISSTCFYPIQASEIQKISIVMTDGEYGEQPEGGPYGGWNYTGSFIIEGRDAQGNLISSLDLNGAFKSEELVFGSAFELKFEDYNQDGYMDFTIGQWGSSNGYIYRLFTVGEDSDITMLPIEGDYDIFSSCFDYSTYFEKAGDTVFLVPFYDNTVGKNQIAYYQWDGTKYKVQKTEISEY